MKTMVHATAAADLDPSCRTVARQQQKWTNGTRDRGLLAFLLRAQEEPLLGSRWALRASYPSRSLLLLQLWDEGDCATVHVAQWLTSRSLARLLTGRGHTGVQHIERAIVAHFDMTIDTTSKHQHQTGRQKQGRGGLRVAWYINARMYQSIPALGHVHLWVAGPGMGPPNASDEYARGTGSGSHQICNDLDRLAAVV